MSPQKPSFKRAFEEELARRLTNTEGDEAIVRWASEQLLQSYKNGIAVGQKGGTVIRQGQSRGRSLPSQAR
jgi:hypothetical protein